MAYKVGIVGEANYQATIAACRVGDVVHVSHEIGNPYDRKALVVTTAKGQPIGYIGKDHWIRDLVHEEERACGARICSINEAAPGKLAVVLDVEKRPGPIPTRSFKR